MLWSEFSEGTGCKETEYNFKIYQRLELLYLADDSITKQEIYDYGKKLVDNSKTEKEIEFENKIKAELKEKKDWLKELRADIERYKSYLTFENEYSCYYKENIKNIKEQIKKVKSEIARLKMVLD